MSKADLPRILVAEDEPDMLQLIKMNLQGAGYRVIEAEDGAAALTAAREERPALVVLDLMLPGMSGLEVCRALKRETATASLPIIMLTARAEEVDRIVGFELGADDYITKPFSPRELILRIQSILRRSKPAATAAASTPEDDELKLGVIAIDRARCEVQVKKKRIELTATELKLLTTLIERRGRVQSRDTLLNDVWGYESIIDTRTVDTHIRRLREKLGPAAADYIETIRGFGYRMVEPV
jgi:two-component system phosphate regulon response regulator PhoB